MEREHTDTTQKDGGDLVRPMKRNPLHEEIQRQARLINVLKDQLRAAFVDLGQTGIKLAVAPLEGQLKQPYQPKELVSDQRPHADYWPSITATARSLVPYPGNTCFTLKDESVRRIGYSVCGISRNELRRIVTIVMEQQEKKMDFVPLFLTDCTDFDIFRERGYSFEYLPPKDKWELVPGAQSWEEYSRCRVQSIREQWGLCHIVQFGTTAFGGVGVDSTSERISESDKIVYYKDYSRYNPYQQLLYDNLRGFQATSGTILDATTVLQTRTANSGSVIFHLNWEEGLFSDSPTEAEAEARVRAFLLHLQRFIQDGGVFVWTIHNFEPHENLYPKLHRNLCQTLGRLSHVIHLHTPAAVDRLCELYCLPREKLEVVPHGNYVPLYTPHNDRAAAKQALGIPTGRRCLLFFGNVRPYKGVDRLLTTFKDLDSKTTWLIIAGKQRQPLDPSQIKEAGERLTVIDQFVRHEDVPAIFAAADFTVLPFRDILSSGVLMLSFSLGVPVIVPQLASLLDLVRHGVNGFFVDSDGASDLAEVLRTSVALDEARLDGMRQAALATGQRYDWQWIGRRMSVLFRKACQRRDNGFRDLENGLIAVPVRQLLPSARVE